MHFPNCNGFPSITKKSCGLHVCKVYLPHLIFSQFKAVNLKYSIQIRPLLIRSHAWFDRRLEPCKAADGPTRPPGWGFRTPELQTFCSFSPLFKHCTIQESATLQKRWSVMIRRQFNASLPDLGPTLKTLLYCHWKKVTLLGSKTPCSVVLCICGYDENCY